MAQIIILPVVSISRQPPEPLARFDRSGVVDLNARRYARERAAAERREMSSLLSAGDSA